MLIQDLILQRSMPQAPITWPLRPTTITDVVDEPEDQPLKEVNEAIGRCKSARQRLTFNYLSWLESIPLAASAASSSTRPL